MSESPHEFPNVDVVGHRATAYHPGRPLAAVEMLLRGLEEDQLRAIKFRSGEHVAAIAATTVHFGPPVAVDIDGGPDLEFAPSGEWERPGEPIAYEVKSVAGEFRRYFARSGDQDASDELAVVVRAIDDIVGDLVEVVSAADRSLAIKVPSGTSRNVVLVLHPFDAFPIELANEVTELLLGAALSASFSSTGLDTVMVVVVPPGSMAEWSRKLDGWQSIVFAADEDGPSELHPIMRAANAFMDHVHPGVESPYSVSLVAPPDDRDET